MVSDNRSKKMSYVRPRKMNGVARKAKSGWGGHTLFTYIFLLFFVVGKIPCWLTRSRRVHHPTTRLHVPPSSQQDSSSDFNSFLSAVDVHVVKRCPDNFVSHMPHDHRLKDRKQFLLCRTRVFGIIIWTCFSAHKNPISRALYKAALSWWLEMRQNGKFNWKTGKQKKKD